MLFQFHKGTIRTKKEELTNLQKGLNFNSIKVQLEPSKTTDREVKTNFNSIKVQLEHDMQRYYTDYMLFQFHKGTIRTWY